MASWGDDALTRSGPLSLRGGRSYGRQSRKLFPTGLHGVAERRRREECSTRRLSPTDTAEAQREAFDRVFKVLLEKRVVAARDGLVWIARHPADGHGQETDTSQPVRPARRSPEREAGPQPGIAPARGASADDPDDPLRGLLEEWPAFGPAPGRRG